MKVWVCGGDGNDDDLRLNVGDDEGLWSSFGDLKMKR